jgi:chorismate synthase
VNTFGKHYAVTVFGESHGTAIGCVIDGIPAGFALDRGRIDEELRRRRPGQSELSTTRKETDNFKIVSGLLGRVTTGAPLTAFCRNIDTRSSDYQTGLARPGHADFPAFVKYDGFNDARGGGMFSGRLTAPLVFAGAIAKQIIESRVGAVISAQPVNIGGVTDPDLFQKVILEAKAEGDSVGGVIECTVTGLPPGLGEPLYSSVESEIASIVFAVPAVKGIEFGDGFNIANRYGSEVNDGYDSKNGKISMTSNHNGGVLGGITNGADLVFRVAVKPTPTISKPQQTVNLVTGESIEHSFVGRHDPCIVPRAVPVIEAACAVALIQFIL